MKHSPYLILLLGSCGAIVLLAVAANWLVDPMRYYHRPWMEIGYSENERYQVPGLVRHEGYDSVLIGTSHTEIFTPTRLSRELGGRALNLSVSGSTIVEQAAVLDLVLHEGKADRVLWEINYGSFSTGERLLDPSAFPYFLYRPGAETPFRYLVSWDTFEESLAAIAGRRPPTLDDLNRWDLEFEFGAERVMDNWDYMTERWNESLRQTWALYSVRRQEIPRLVQSYVADRIRAHPGVRFDLLFLPTSALDYVNDFQISADRFGKRMALRRSVGRAVADLENAVIWDFQLESDMSLELDRYKDLEHFGQATVQEILGDMQAGRNRVSGEQLEQRTAVLERWMSGYARDFCARQPERCQPALLRNLEEYRP
ncbi:MAG: hypothetical protein PVJ17_05900 [Lysobacterales bacterium]|jgi:hypothetical protein